MEKSNFRRLVTSINLISNILPFYGYTDQCHLMLKQLCRTTYALWDENEKALLTVILKSNKRIVKLTAEHYDNFELMTYF